MRVFSQIAVFFLLLSPTSAFANPNYECSIFRTVTGEYAAGSLTLVGEDPTQQSYELYLSDTEGTELRKFEGTLYLRGMVSLTDLPLETQEAITSSMQTAKKPNLSTGPLIVFSNTEGSSDTGSTMNVYLMPTGDISYIEAGILPVICM
jgi:hypothetical protein